MHTIEVEIERNYAAFMDMIQRLLPAERGRFALLKDKELQGIYDSAGEAERAGYKSFGEAPYSIQEIESEPVDLGFFSYAVSAGAG